jgi:hypothetical protein
MLSIPGADVHPNVRAEAPVKKTHGKTALGTTGKCLALRMLEGGNPMSLAELTAALVKAGKAKSSVPNVLYELKKAKHIRGDSKAYTIAAGGTSFIKNNCDKE